MSYQFKHLNKGSTVGSGSYVFRQYSEQVTPQQEYFLTFSSPNSFTLSVAGNLKYWDGTLETSTDKTTWTTWSGTSSVSSASDGTKHNIYVRGIGNTVISGSNTTDNRYRFRLNGSNISISGNIENLLDYQTVANGQHPAMAQSCYEGLFGYTSASGNSNITDISGLILGAETLTNRCYRQMFVNNTGLVNINKKLLPVTTLTNYCYYQMFSGCSALTNAPELPATNVSGKNSCYEQMFQNCSNLIELPKLYTTGYIQQRCCYKMFYGCSKIKLSTTQTGEYINEYRIPTIGTGSLSGTDPVTDMFTNTGGTFTGTPSINTTYYTSNEPV